MHLIYLCLTLLISTSLLAQEPADKAENARLQAEQALLQAQKARLQAEIQKEIASSGFGRMTDPAIRAKRLYRTCKEKLVAAKIRYKNQSFLPDETLESLGIAIEKLEKKKDAYLQVRNTIVASSVATKAKYINDDEQRALLIKEAYEINVANKEQAPYNPLIYKALYNTVLDLEPYIWKEEPFNQLSTLSNKEIRSGIIRKIIIGKNSDVVYTLDSQGFLLKRTVSIFDSPEERAKEINLPQIIMKERCFRRKMEASPDGASLAFIGDSDRILIQSLNPEKKPIYLATHHADKRIFDLKYTPDGKGIITLGYHPEGRTTIIRHTLLSGKSSILNELPAAPRSIELSADGEYLAIIKRTPAVSIFSILAKKDIFSLADTIYKKKATALAFHPIKQLVAIGYEDGSMMIWDLDKLKDNPSYRPDRLLYHRSMISDLEFSEDGVLLVVGSFDKTATLWKIWDKKHLGEGNEKEFPYLKNYSYNPITFSNHKDWVTAVAFSNDGTNSKVITGTGDGNLFVWEVDPAVYANRICSLVDQNLEANIWKKYFDTDDPSGEALYLDLPNNKRRTFGVACRKVN